MDVYSEYSLRYYQIATDASMLRWLQYINQACSVYFEVYDALINPAITASWPVPLQHHLIRHIQYNGVIGTMPKDRRSWAKYTRTEVHILRSCEPEI